MSVDVLASGDGESKTSEGRKERGTVPKLMEVEWQLPEQEEGATQVNGTQETVNLQYNLD